MGAGSDLLSAGNTGTRGHFCRTPRRGSHGSTQQARVLAPAFSRGLSTVVETAPLSPLSNIILKRLERRRGGRAEGRGGVGEG